MAKFSVEFRDIKPEGIRPWLEAQTNPDDPGIQRRAIELKTIYFHGQCEYVVEPYKYLWESARCYILGYYLATISLCSATVEHTWNRDPRLTTVRMPRRDQRGWITLNQNNLIECHNQGLPVVELLSESEQSEIPNFTSIPKFIDIRNKIDHGEIEAYLQGFPIPRYSQQAELEAKEQIMKCNNYFVRWANQVCEQS